MFPLAPFVLDQSSEAHLNSDPGRTAQDGIGHIRRMYEQMFIKSERNEAFNAKGYSGLELAGTGS